MSKLRIVIGAALALAVAGCSSSGRPSAGPGPSAGVTASATAPATAGSPPPASGSASPSDRPSNQPPVAAGPKTLPVGKGDLVLTPGPWRSPAGFLPAVSLMLPAGWTSVHRGADAFDLGRPDPALDAPLVAIVFLTPKEPTAAEALTDVTTRANGNVEPTIGMIGGRHADTVDIVGGSGQLIASRSGGIALDAADGQQVRLFTLTVDGSPLVVAVLIPQSGRWDAVWPDVQSVLAGAKFG